MILVELKSTATLRDIVKKDLARILRVPMPDEEVFLDMDIPADYKALHHRVS